MTEFISYLAGSDLFLSTLGIVTMALTFATFTQYVVIRFISRRRSPMHKPIMVFLSYSQHSDMSNVISKKIRHRLFLFDPYSFIVSMINEDIHYGDIVNERISTMISASDVIIMIVTNDYLRSNRLELEEISNQDKPIIPVVVDNEKIDSMLPEVIKSRKFLCIDSSDNTRIINKKIGLLLDSVRKQMKHERLNYK